MWRATHWLSKEGLTFDVGQIVWTSNPIDHLWMRLQYFDSSGSSLLDVVHPAMSPFGAAQREYAGMILMPLGESDLRSLAFHFASQEDELVTACRRFILDLS